MSSKPSVFSASPVKLRSKVNTRSARKVHKFLLRITEPVDELGASLLGEWWRILILAVQDAIGIGILLWIPNSVFKFFSYGKDFSTLTSCWQISLFDPSIVACLGLVIGEYCLWTLFVSRTLARFFHQIRFR